MKAIWVRRIYQIILTVALIVAAACLIGGSLHIYKSGGVQIYTLKKIGQTFKYIAIPVYIALALTIGSFILELFLPAPRKKKPRKNYELILKNLQQRADLSKCTDRELCSNIRSLRKQRKALAIISFVLLGVCSVVFLIYALRIADYPSLMTEGHRVTEAMIANAIVWGICLLIPFVFAATAAYLSKASKKTEIDLLNHVALGKKPPKEVAKNCTLQLNIIRGALLTLAVALIVVGAIGDGWQDVLAKAVAICTECVGLG